MALDMPSSATEIAGVMESAGQLGIATESVTDFAKTMIDLGNATNLTADQAASSLAKFANITGMSADNYRSLGSVIVDLGNNFATTEADIVNMSTYLTSAASVAGFAETDIMALSAAMSSVGINAEAGGSSMSKLISMMQTAVEVGGEGLQAFADVANMTAEEFATEWGTNAVGALQAFVGGLNDVERNGKSMSVILQDLDLDDIRMSNMLKALAQGNTVLTSAVEKANTAWKENTALTNEVEKRYATLESKMQMMQNAANDLKISVGNSLTPAMGLAADAATDLMEGLSGFARENQALTAGIMGTVGTVGTAIGGFTTLAPAITAASTAMQAFNISTKTLAIGGGVIGGIAALAGVTMGLVTAFSNAKDEVEDYNGTLEECRNEINATQDSYNAVVSMYGAQSEAAKSLSDQLDMLNAQYDKGGGSVADYAQRVKDSAENYQKWKNEYSEQMKSVENSTTTAQIAVAQLQSLSEKSVKTNADLNMMGKYADYLNDTFQCNIEVNYETGKLTGFDPTNANSLIIAQAKANLQNAAISNYTSPSTQESYIEKHREFINLKKQYEDLKTFYDEVYGDNPWQMYEPGGADFVAWQGTYEKLKNTESELKTAETTFKGFRNTMQGMAVAGGVADTFDSYISYLDQMADGADTADKSFKIFKDDFVGESQSMQSIVAEQKKQLEDNAITDALQSLSPMLMETAQAYDEMYQAAYKSLSEQYGLFDKAKDKITEVLDAFNKDNETSYSGIGGVLQARADALESQLKDREKLNSAVEELSKEKYNNILMTEDKAKQLYINSAADAATYQSEAMSMWDDYKDTMLTKIANGDAEAQAELLAVSAELKKGHTGMVTDIVEKWGELDTETKSAAEGIGKETADVQQSMAMAQTVIATSLVSIGLESIQAYNASKGVVDSLASGISAGYASLREQVSAVESLMSRLASFNVSASMPTTTSSGGSGKTTTTTVAKQHLASGTRSAMPGLTLVGENGPELLMMQGGETVFNADETKRMMQSMTDVYIPKDINEEIGMKEPEWNGSWSDGSGGSRDKTITINIGGGDTIRVQGGVSRDDVCDLLVSNLKPALMSIISEEIFEEGEGSYEY